MFLGVLWLGSIPLQWTVAIDGSDGSKDMGAIAKLILDLFFFGRIMAYLGINHDLISVLLNKILEK
jgi:hypothetical protein